MSQSEAFEHFLHSVADLPLSDIVNRTLQEVHCLDQQLSRRPRRPKAQVERDGQYQLKLKSLLNLVLMGSRPNGFSSDEYVRVRALLDNAYLLPSAK